MRFELPLVLIGLAKSVSAHNWLDWYADSPSCGGEPGDKSWVSTAGEISCTKIGRTTSVETSTDEGYQLNLYDNSNCAGSPLDFIGPNTKQACTAGHYLSYEVVPYQA